VQVNSFPTLMLFDGKTTHTLTTDRSIPGLEKWFSEVLPEVFGGADADASRAAANPRQAQEAGAEVAPDGDAGPQDKEEAATPSPPPSPSKSKGKGKGKGKGATAGGSLVQDISFKSLVAASGSRVAFFYFTSDDLHEPVGCTLMRLCRMRVGCVGCVFVCVCECLGACAARSERCCGWACPLSA